MWDAASVHTTHYLHCVLPLTDVRDRSERERCSGGAVRLLSTVPNGGRFLIKVQYGVHILIVFVRILLSALLSTR